MELLKEYITTQKIISKNDVFLRIYLFTVLAFKGNIAVIILIQYHIITCQVCLT